jgi:hypothetical protein
MAEKPDMDTPRTFFDPHPGFAGAAIPIPGLVKAIAEDLDGQTLSLTEAVARLRTVGIGSIEVVAQHQYIGLRLGGGGNPEHFFRVIRYC